MGYTRRGRLVIYRNPLLLVCVCTLSVEIVQREGTV
jgi:hypothetical protein